MASRKTVPEMLTVEDKSDPADPKILEMEDEGGFLWIRLAEELQEIRMRLNQEQAKALGARIAKYLRENK